MGGFRTLVAAGAALWVVPALAAGFSGDQIKIGVLTDESGQFSTIGGKGSVLAAQMAVKDFGGTIDGKPIVVVDADHQNKPDVGSAILRRWFDQEGVDAVTDLPVSSVALAAQEIAREKHKTLLISGAASSALTGKACSPYSTQWADDSYALARGTAKAVVAAGGKSWFFLTADYAFGADMEKDATAAITAAGGTVAGAVRHPLGTSDFSSFLLQAQSSKAKVVGLANAGGDTVSAIKQAVEFGLPQGGQSLAGFLIFITDVHALTPQVAQNLYVTEGFYWDQNDAARAFAKRFFDEMGRMPTKQQAATYASVTHYLKAARAAGTVEAAAVNKEMRQLPVDFFGRAGSIRPDGRVLYDLTLYRVKAPEAVKRPWDYYQAISTIPAADAFRPAAEGGCPLQ
ncbi:ABC transporter permease [Aliidongia dinghuensis]|uniref:ABC transporter permease n=1 Tax=Aliidongia dinghuensis TaxID=1867774 RepID=A0A8J2YZ36_9PROT|nr:ABC transporter substrate-binding protein [Aliidongia dinghuensis]GGF41343.1 ABC transporter permease [Aliidongia dinghuensis]